ncbi:ArsR family transcriptional regulator [Candidatus Bathyarchaeota archaeon]|nr:MAG: ArsR family transcriptional regulator [Candidatus Bathyarchaeota archaeon]TMI52991.1 MAG: ArsR family transcriptional regulator [Candidatus Bathyarchaeota archaeon]
MVNTSADLTRKSLLNINDSSNGTLLLEVIEERIISSLGDKPNSSISEIAKDLRVNRSTASKYLHVLRAKKKVAFRQVGPVKLWSLEEQ